MGTGIGGILLVLYFALIIGITIYVIVLATRFVKAHQRGAEALESIAQTLNNQR
jgi:predicted RND superfamily exporter protein